MNPQLKMKLENMPVPMTADMIDAYMGPILEAGKTGDLCLIRMALPEDLCCREEACFGDGLRFVQIGLSLGSPFHSARFDLYLSGADETTPGTTLYSCPMGTHVPTAPHWHFASDNGYAVTQIADHDTVKPWRTLYRCLHKIEDGESSGPAANRTPAEIASLVWEITKASLS